MVKIDPYNHEKLWNTWKESINGKIPDLSRDNSDIILSYLNDMEIGINVACSSKKGSRSFTRLNSLRNRIIFVAKKIEQRYSIPITNLKEEQIYAFFHEMSSGKLKTKENQKYKSTADYIKIFKAFWHWYQKISRKQGIEIKDITIDLDTRREKPEWVYLNNDQVKQLAEESKYEYKVLIWFLFDTGIRAPTELMNVKVSDFSDNFTKLSIRGETSKTFGRKINLLICHDIIKEYIAKLELKSDNYLFDISPPVVNRYLQRLANKLFGDKTSLAGKSYNLITMYDFRHSSACYWLPRYKSESALKYRFGWKKSEMIHYYTELLGMKDTIAEEDILIDVTKTEIEKQLQKTQKENELLQEKMLNIEKQLRIVKELMKIAGIKTDLIIE